MAVRLPDVSSSFPLKTGHLFMIGALVLAIVSAVMIKNIATSTKAPEIAKPKIVTKQIVVAAVPISAGTALSMDDLKLVEWPADYIPSSSVYYDLNGLAGRVVKSDILPGEPLYKEKMAGELSNGGLPVIIPKGMRAVSVAVTEIKGVAGFVKPGDKVDLIATFHDDESGSKEHVTRTVLQNVLVLASAQQMVDNKIKKADIPPALSQDAATTTIATNSNQPAPAQQNQKSKEDIEKERKAREDEMQEAEKRAKLVASVTLALTPEQAETLALAENMGDIRLVLRAEGDNSVAEVPGTASSELIRGKGMKMPDAPPPVLTTTAIPAMPAPGRSIEFIEGTEKTTLDF